MHRVVFPRLLVVALLAAIALAVVRVASVPTAPAAPGTSYTWESAVTQVADDLRATVEGIRSHVRGQQATYAKMWRDTQQLEEQLSSPPRP